MIYKLCRKCKKLIVHPASYCVDCLKIVNKRKEEIKKQYESKYNKKRDPKYKKFYSSKEWGLLKDRKMMNEEYKCERCGKLATEVHHIKPIQIEHGWSLRLEYTNLKAVCVECHNYYHNRFKKKEKRK